MRILIIGLNFSPELIGIGKYSGEMAAWLSEKGHQVRVITTPPYYPAWRIAPGYSGWKFHRERVGEIDVWRCPLWVPRRVSGLKRLLHLASFGLSSLPVIMLNANWRAEIVLCVVPTLFVAPWALLLSRLIRAPAWLHIHDFEMDAAFELGLLSKRSMTLRILNRIEARLLRGFQRVSSLSKKMVDVLEFKGVERDRTSLLPNWADLERIYPLDGINRFRTSLDLPQDQIVVLYAGNFGVKQGIETLLETAEQLQEQHGITFVLCGDGAAGDRVRALAGRLTNVILIPLQPLEGLNELLNLADIQVLPQRAGVADLVMPSKLGGMLASGKPVVATADPDTEVGAIVEEVGICVPPGAAEELGEAILRLAGNPGLREKLGTRGRQFAEKTLNKAKILSELEVALSRMHAQ